MNIYIPENVIAVLEKLESCGFEAYIVGGCVRDAILGKIPKDYDISTSAKPEEIKKCFEGYNIIETGIKHGTVTIVSEGENIEVTTFRIDGNMTTADTRSASNFPIIFWTIFRAVISQ